MYIIHLVKNNIYFNVLWGEWKCETEKYGTKQQGEKPGKGSVDTKLYFNRCLAKKYWHILFHEILTVFWK